MSVVVWENLLGRHEAQLSLQGWEFERRAVVTGLIGTSSVSRLRAAVQALADQGVYLGAAHPDIFTAKCEVLRPVARAVDVVEVDVTYREHASNPNNPPSSQLGIIQVGASISQITTDKDADGNVISVTYTGTQLYPDYAHAVPSGGQTQRPKISAPRPQTTIHITRQENANPINKARQFVGTTNSGAWAADPGCPVKSWLCTAITGQTRDGRTYEVSYSFQFANVNAFGEQSWDDGVFWVDPGTGLPPGNAALGSSPGGVARVKVAGTNDFNALALA